MEDGSAHSSKATCVPSGETSAESLPSAGVPGSSSLIALPDRSLGSARYRRWTSPPLPVSDPSGALPKCSTRMLPPSGEVSGVEDAAGLEVAIAAGADGTAVGPGVDGGDPTVSRPRPANASSPTVAATRTRRFIGGNLHGRCAT